MGLKHLILAALCLIGMPFASPFPHTGMINDEFARDVGAVYSKPGYQGDGSFLLEFKGEPRCMSLRRNIASIQICIPASCTFYTTQDCQQDSDRSSFTVNGPGDVHEVPVPKGNYCSYICGTNENVIAQGAVTLDTTPHDSSKDQLPSMVLETTEHDKEIELQSDMWHVPSA
ncbi:Nn.00g075590.m01.CDS01 [Neocucurbitaria sp. VM-36]